MRDEHGASEFLFVRKLVLGMAHSNLVEKARAFAAARRSRMAVAPTLARAHRC
jgi:hypothetical protein